MNHVSTVDTDTHRFLGAFAVRTSGTIYQAATDGFVSAYGASPLEIFVDTFTPPTTLRQKDTGGGENAASIAVAKDEYYKCTATILINWRPLEP